MDRNFESEFYSIIEQYKISPFGFRLRRTGNILKLSEYNGLYYIDLVNIFKIVNELLGPNISNEIIEYINKIIFPEVISIETSRGTETKTMTCVQFIDNSFFSKCLNWINERSEQEANEYNLFFGSILSPNERLLRQNENQDIRNTFNPFIDSMSPFNNTISDRHLNYEYENTNFKSLNTSRPRGKQMNMSETNLNERPFVCDIAFCNRAFKRYEHLKRHMKMHTGDKPFTCNFPNCNKSFSRSDNLQQHKKTHGSYVKSEKQIRFQNEFSKISKY